MPMARKRRPASQTQTRMDATFTSAEHVASLLSLVTRGDLSPEQIEYKHLLENYACDTDLLTGMDPTLRAALESSLLWIREELGRAA